MEINFSDSQLRRKRRSNLALVLLLIFILALLLIENQRQQQRKQEVEMQLALADGSATVETALPTESDLNAERIAKTIVHRLNFPWQDLFNALEQVKQKVKDVQWLSIQPNPAKQELLINAIAPDVTTMLALVISLENSNILNNVLIMNQRQYKQNLDAIQFTVKMTWVLK